MAFAWRSRALRPLAAVAVCLVAYSYLLAWWLNSRGRTPEPLLVVREWINVPLGIGEDFGVLGLGLLLAVGGFTVTESVARRGAVRTGIALAARAGVPLALFALLTVALVQADAAPLSVADTGKATPLGSSVAAFGFGWVVWTAVVFTVLTLASAALARRLPTVAFAVHAGVLAVLVHLGTGSAHVGTGADIGSGPADDGYARLGMLAAFGVFPLIGAVVWAVVDRRLPGWAGGFLGAGCYAVLAVADRGYPAFEGWWYPLTWLYVAGLVVLVASKRLPCPVPVRWVADRAYALSLAMGVAGYATMNMLADRVPAVLTIAAGLAVTVAVAELAHRLVARRLLARVVAR